MKKLVKNAICILLIVTIILLESCAKHTPKGHETDYTLYEMAGAYDSTSQYTHNGDIYVFETPEINTAAVSQERKLTFQGKTYSLAYTFSWRQDMFPYDIDDYECTDYPGFIFSFRHDTGKLATAGVKSPNLELVKVDGAVEEANYRNAAEMILKEYISIEEYELTCSTRIEVQSDTSLSYENSDEFVVTDAPAEYHFLYQRKISGYLSGDSAEVVITNDGRVTGITFAMQDTFDAYEDITIDTEKINEIIDQKVKAACDTDSITLKSYETSSILVIGNEEELLLLVIVIPEVEPKNPDVTVWTERCMYLIKVAELD